MRAVVGVCAVLLFATAPKVLAQNAEAVPTSEIASRLVNLPIRSVDGQPIGIVTHAGFSFGDTVLIGEVERPLGLGPELIAISADVFVDMGDHIQLALTAAQVREKLAKTDK